MRRFVVSFIGIGWAALASLVAACSDGGERAGPAPAEPPGVTVVAARSSPFSQTAEFIGQTEAFQTVDLRARVTGFLVEKAFEDGATVERDQLLFRIDPAEYQVALDSATAAQERADAELLNARQQLDRVSELVKKETASRAQLDERTAQEAAARAGVSAAKADVDKARLNLGYTQIHSPIAGRIGRSAFDVGNLVGPDSGVLASVVAQDPVRVVFSVSEKTYLSVQARKDEQGGLAARIRLADGTIYDRPGSLQFVDNEVDTGTGTIRVFLQFPNPDHLLLPGLYVTVVLSSDREENRILLPQSAVQLNQAGAFVLVVDGESRVEARPVTTGDRRDGDIVVLDGLSEGETVIVEGIQKVRPGMTVTPAFPAAADG